MFKKESSEKELFESMSNNLKNKDLDQKYGFSKIHKAAELISLAADIFDKNNLAEQSEELTQILESLK